jgi:hypothetical protein
MMARIPRTAFDDVLERLDVREREYEVEQKL